MKRFAILLPLLAIGCFRTSPPVVFHTLTPLVQETGSPGASTCVLEVMPVALPDLLHRSQLVARGGSDALTLLESHRWGNALDKDMQRVLTDNLGALLGSGAVVNAPYGDKVQAKYRLTLEVHRCDGQPGGILQFRGTWMVTRRRDGQAVLLREASLQEPVSGREAEALVAAHNRALAALCRTMATEIKALKEE
jgi:hypothetical protein